MTLFRRQPDPTTEAECCPECGERLPENAPVCTMCGSALEALDERARGDHVNDEAAEEGTTRPR